MIIIIINLNACRNYYSEMNAGNENRIREIQHKLICVNDNIYIIFYKKKKVKKYTNDKKYRWQEFYRVIKFYIIRIIDS